VAPAHGCGSGGSFQVEGAAGCKAASPALQRRRPNSEAMQQLAAHRRADQPENCEQPAAAGASAGAEAWKRQQGQQ